jgi:hypothetical protein
VVPRIEELEHVPGDRVDPLGEAAHERAGHGGRVADPGPDPAGVRSPRRLRRT